MSQQIGDSMSRQYVINIPDYVKEQADAGKAEELGIPLWLAYEIANGTPFSEFAESWIPVSERVPEAEYGESDSVLVCFENGTQDVLYKVVAWMPLPKRYESPESEGSESKRYAELAKSYVQGLR